MQVNQTQSTHSYVENPNIQSTTSQMETKFAYYDLLEGTKYKKRNCALLLGTATTLGGVAVTALVDQPTRNNILVGAGTGFAASILYLWKSVASLKPLAERGIIGIQTHIRRELRSCLMEKNSTNKNIEEVTKELKNLEPRAIAEREESTIKAQQQFADKLANYEQQFTNMTSLLGGYLGVRGIITLANNIDEDIPCTNTQNRTSDNNNTRKYIKAAAAFYTFVSKGSNDYFSQCILINNLRDCLEDSEIIAIKSFMYNCPKPPKFYRNKGSNEITHEKLQRDQMHLVDKNSNIKDKIETFQKKYGIEVNADGKIIFPNLQEFVEYLPN